MREFMDYVHSAFYEATGWSRDNSYAALNATSDALLNFPTPRGLRLTLSALASPNFATSYQLGSVGVVDGSISYLFSSVPLRVLLTPQSEKVALPALLRSYRPLTPLTLGTTTAGGPSPDDDATGEPQASLLYGRLYLPQSQLEALVVRRLSRHLQVQFSAVSGQHLRNGGTTLGLAQYDVGKYAVEGLASSDGGLLGLRGTYNFGGDAEPPRDVAARNGSDEPTRTTTPPPPAPAPNGEKERIYGRFSTGAEIYYGTLNKSGGISLAARFATLPSHKGTPLAATLTLNPLMGSVGASYSVVAGRHCTLATRMEFNVFSYESAWAVGMELWRKPFVRPSPDPSDGEGPSSSLPQIPPTPTSSPDETIGPRSPPERSFRAKMEWRLDEPPPPEHKGQKLLANRADDAAAASGAAYGTPSAGPTTQGQEPEVVAGRETELLSQPGSQAHEEYAGVLKARFDQNLRIGLLWEGRVKSLLFSLGSGIDLRHLDKPFRTLGLEIQFSS
ncbi:hypothetical protein ISF_01058 [Cordyceps fumosorosea ARSEF 2679]|uniref:Mitochondrial distribution and morphology protein 10 n=1 Tax=Cordyceps fumosorosea (strain ARSEF 2679) TaxID=1081104 RepID=A0A168ESH0_CORFA|nr:hypothetical protein ISF_01058 [Cordyceps fumosorosea ARSEF 2679]OAA74157.1 hypothetical protein ISF_01058 [Cordyceps fumosorosea ARSEF 2679]